MQVPLRLVGRAPLVAQIRVSQRCSQALGSRDAPARTSGGPQLLSAAGRHEEVVAQAEPLAQAEAPYPMVLYNVACGESTLGRTEDALGQLRRAVE